MRGWPGSWLLTLMVAAMAASAARASAPGICGATDGAASPPRAPPVVADYVATLQGQIFSLREACARWAGMSYNRARSGNVAPAAIPWPARFILFPAEGTSLRQLGTHLRREHGARDIEISRAFLVAELPPTSGERLQALLAESLIQYAEPDCDGPDFLTTSVPLPENAAGQSCWQREARSTFPNDPCIDDLWGHSMIGWDSSVAARSLPRRVAVLDSGIDASHEDLATRVSFVRLAAGLAAAPGLELNARCAVSGRCYPHGTEMAGTIAGRMDNGIGVAGVAPNSQLLPIVISRVDRGLLARLSTIAQGIETAAASDAEVINISAKWPVDSRAISEAVLMAVGGNQARRRLIITGYATSLDRDDSVREYYPSRYRCLPGVVAAVPADMRGQELTDPKGAADPADGRIQAPGVDIVVTTTENSERGYALSGAAGASSAAAYVSGAVALVWGSPPLNKCDAQQIKRLLFCRSKRSDSTRYPWVHVDFLRELATVDPAADCSTATAALGCP
jgi:hypothetical protein